MDDYQRMILAYHEAGHIAIHWFFGTHQDFLLIDMRGGFVKSKPSSTEDEIRSHVKTDLHVARIEAAKTILHYLAGPYAEHVASKEKYEWFFLMSVRYMFVNDEPASEVEAKCDMACAKRAALAVCNDDWSDALHFVQDVGRWVEELLSIPRFWTCVESLAKRLQTADILTRNPAWEIMKEAWGDGDTPPYMHLGEVWVERFVSG